MRVQRRSYSMPELGPENPLPLVGAPLENPYQITGDVPREIIDGSHYGNPVNLYPYLAQDGYGRSRSQHELTTVVLENERLRAVFLPELGGRLWELFDKQSGKNLLHTQPSIQFANLALRNAWFAGGLEWNIGTRGHSPSTCSPLHAGIVHTPEGQEVLRMWEFDRLREVVFQIDAWLPPDSAVLFVAIRIRNPNSAAVPMYWWSNAAVPELEGSRILVPADSAFASDYVNGISRVDPTDDGDRDCTWPANNPRARDFFFDIPTQHRRWILNADQDGDGLAMLSTDRPRGRKLFVWGQGAGGQRWQRWLNPDGGRYAEIQTGLAQTQFQHLEMPARTEWSWLEAYGNARLDPALAHAPDWASAVEHGESRVEALLGESDLRGAHASARRWADMAPRHVQLGSGWGALESLRRRHSATGWIDESGTPFSDESMGDDQQPWRDLLRGSGFSGAATFVAGRDWEARLEATLAEPVTSAGHVVLHLAVMLHARGELDAARVRYRESLDDDAPSVAANSLTTGRAEHPLGIAAQAHRGLAVIALFRQQRTAGLAHYEKACALEPGSVALLVEAATACLAADAADIALALVERANAPTAEHGRIRFLQALALARVGQSERAAAILKAGLEVADLREGENSLSALWQRVCPDEPVPDEYQFRMT